jgi:tetratricopeptide (TPR) repeat protein/predicted Ser/Thr protein kinase
MATPQFRTEPNRPSVLAPRTRIGRYVISHEIGAGGMGVVYAAHDPELDRAVAVKVMLGGSDLRFQERLRREAQAMAKLTHPNVITVYDVGEHDDCVFIAMEYIAGETLEHWLTAPRPQREILELFRAAGRGLAAAHEAGIVHRDFKPENVLIGNDGRVRVGDFGVARSLHGAPAVPMATIRPVSEVDLSSSHEHTIPTPLTVAGTLVGTPHYMAPEVVRGEEASARSDQFSFCVALFVALYGELPFQGDSLDALCSSILTGRLREPESASQVPRRIRAAIRRGLATDPAERFPSVDDLLIELAPRHRRRALWALAPVALAALAALAWLAMRSPGALLDQRCSGAAAAFAAVWNPERRGAIEAAFNATRAPYAGVAFLQVAGAIDRYGERWIAAHTDACRATQILGEQSAATLDLRMTCLERRRQEAGALTGELAAARDAGLIARAVTAAVGLPDVAACADLAALRQIVPPPGDTATRTRLAELTPRLADARAKRGMGELAPALELARAVAADARALGYRPFEAEATLLQGQLERELNKPEAEATLQAAALSAEAGRHDEVAARARAILVFLVGYEQAQYERGLQLVPAATAALERLGGNSDIESLLERALGAIDADQSKLDTAIPHFEKAVALAQRAFGDDHPGVASVLGNLGMAVMARGDAARAIELHQRALHIYETLLGPNHPTTAIARHDLGNAHFSAGDTALAEQEIRSALAIREAAVGSDHPDVAANLSDLSRVLRRRGKIEDALALTRRALVIGEKAFGAEHPSFAAQLLGFALDLNRAGKYAETDAPLRRAEAIYTKLHGADHVDVARVRTVRGEVLMRQRRWKDAAATFADALPVLASSPAAGELLIGTQVNLALAYVELHRPARALALLERLAGDPDALKPRGRAALEYTLARALWDSGRDRKRARALARRALDGLRGLEGTPPEQIAEIERWLASHRAR